MNLEKYNLYQILIISAIIIPLILCLVIPFLIVIFPIVFFIGIILLAMVRKRGNIDDERAIKISEKASEKTIIVFVFGAILLNFVFGGILVFLKIVIFKDGFPDWIFELIGSMFHSAIIISLIYLTFYVYYRYIYGGVLK